MRKSLFVLWFTPVFLLTLVAQPALACCADEDHDDYGVENLDWCPNPEPDCEDTNPDIHPGVTEGAYGEPMCDDGVDNDCDGRIDMMDEGCFECTLPEDCDDGNPCTDDLCVENVCANVNNTALCDDGDVCTVDDVCNNGECSGAPLDADEDGYTSDQCGGGDCDDSDAEVNPGSTEAPFGAPICADQVDNDCDGLVDLQDNGCLECTVPGDCDDANACTGDDCVNNECVHVDNTDLDADGFPSDLCSGTDCDDSDPDVHPGAWEGPAGDPTCTDGVDNNCNGYMDLDEAGCTAKTGWGAAETADAAVYGTGSGEGSKGSNLLFTFLLPMGAMVLLRRILGKR